MLVGDLMDQRSQPDADVRCYQMHQSKPNHCALLMNVHLRPPKNCTIITIIDIRLFPVYRALLKLLVYTKQRNQYITYSHFTMYLVISIKMDKEN
jgi:hypothetical protein